MSDCCCHHHEEESHKDSSPNLAAWGKYTCPMHPEIIRDEPGDCPICGMALEGVGPVPEDRSEERDFVRRLLIGAALTLPVFVLGMAHFYPSGDFRTWAMGPVSMGIQGLLATPVFLWCGLPFHRRAWQSVVSRRANMFTLISLGTTAAWVFSVWQLLSGGHHLYFEAAAMIIVLALAGQVMESRGRRRAGEALRGLLDLTPQRAMRIAKGKDEEVLISELVAGDHIRIRPGERFPVDGEVLEGRSDVDESAMTGEAARVSKDSGSTVLAGTMNGSGSLVIRTTHAGQETMLGHIIQMVASAQQSRMPVQNLADRIAEWFVPVVLLIAVATAVVWALVSPELALPNAVAVLIIACPCAIGLATPMSVTVAVGHAAGLGILVREASSLQAVATIDTLALDKTGTLTQGRPQVTEVQALGTFSRDSLLTLAAAVERASEHPLARAVLQASEGLTIPPATGFASEAGGGVRAIVEGRRVVAGSRAFLSANGTEFPKGEGSIWISVDGEPAGVLLVADAVRPEAAAALREIEALGIRTVMLTGDGEHTAREIARALDLRDWKSSLKPLDKAAVIEDLQRQGHRVVMAGDGINDAPAFSVANVSVAMGAGADIAKESAGLILLKNDLARLATAVRLGRATLSNIRQNLFFAFFYNLLGIPVAAGVLYPLTGWLLSPVIAGLAMSLSSVTVIANALRLQGFSRRSKG